MIDARSLYLGKYGTPQAKKRCDRTIAEWLANRRTARGERRVARESAHGARRAARGAERAKRDCDTATVGQRRAAAIVQRRAAAVELDTSMTLDEVRTA